MIKIRRCWVAYEDTLSTAVDPEYLPITREDIENYIKEHPMPEDPEYTKEDLIYDLTASSGVYTLPDGIKQETADYIEELLNALAR